MRGDVSKGRKCALQSMGQVARVVTLEQLARSGEDVTFFARGEHLKAIQAHGLCVETPTGEMLIQPAKVTDDPKEIGPVDVILLKSFAGEGGCEKYATYGRPCNVSGPVAEWS